MSELRSAHAVWLLRRAAVLDGASPDTVGEAPDPTRATLLRRIAAKVSEAAGGHAVMTLTPAEHTLLVTEADELTARAARELKRTDGRDLHRAEEWVRTAAALRELLEAAGSAS